MDFIMVDTQNGELADRPPNGIASKKSLEIAPSMIGKYIADLADFGLEAVSLMCGQGLVDHAELVEAKLKQGDERCHPPYPDLIVYVAASTAASEFNGVAPPLLGSEGAVRAAMARMAVSSHAESNPSP